MNLNMLSVELLPFCSGINMLKSDEVKLNVNILANLVIFKLNVFLLLQKIICPLCMTALLSVRLKQRWLSLQKLRQKIKSVIQFIITFKCTIRFDVPLCEPVTLLLQCLHWTLKLPLLSTAGGSEKCLKTGAGGLGMVNLNLSSKGVVRCQSNRLLVTQWDTSSLLLICKAWDMCHLRIDSGWLQAANGKWALRLIRIQVQGVVMLINMFV